MGHGTYIKEQFDVGRAKGEADRQKIANAIKRFIQQFWQADFYNMFFMGLVFAFLLFFGSGAYVLAKLIDIGYYIANPLWDYSDANLTNEEIRSILYYYGICLYLSFVLGITSMLSFAFALIKECKRYKSRKNAVINIGDINEERK